jgi:hypothetical protein
VKLKDGARDWNRTSDLLLTKEVLYRLSYTGVKGNLSDSVMRLEREAGIEPAYSAWKADVLPLNYSRLSLDAQPNLVEGGGFEPPKA